MLIGNIGVPPLERFEEMTPDAVAVCEMSCHQLEFVHHSPEIAVLLNIFPEHLDHYVSLEAYAEAKRNIYKFQQAGDVSILNVDLIPDDICTNAECSNAPNCSSSGYRKSRLITIGCERPAMAFAENGAIFLPDREIPGRRGTHPASRKAQRLQHHRGAHGCNRRRSRYRPLPRFPSGFHGA